MQGSRAERMLALFEGARKSHGSYGSERVVDGKAEIKHSARTHRGPPTVALWEKHLEGETPLGVVPVREDDCCLWGAIDVDDYAVDHGAIAASLATAELPGHVCRSKSGGAHIFFFFDEPIPASTVINRLRQIAALLGKGGSEIFPKQEKLPTGDDEFGSWINMPYFGGDAGQRHAVTERGLGITLDQFLARAEASRMTLDDFRALKIRPPTGEYSDGPPCLEILSSQGFPDGSRNAGLFNLGIFFKSKYPDTWQKVLREQNQAVMSPPLEDSEIQDVIKRIGRKDYNYRCRDQPIVSFCNSAVCRLRTHGVQKDEAKAQDIAELSKLDIVLTDPKTYVVTFSSGQSVTCYAEELMSAQAFRKVVFARLDVLLPKFTDARWDIAIRRLLQEATRVEVSSDSGILGQFSEILSNYLVDRSQGDSLESVLLGLPFWHEESGTVHFTLVGLERSLEVHRFSHGDGTSRSRAWVTNRLREMGGKSVQRKIKGKNTNVWELPASRFDRVVPVLDTPDVEDAPV